MAYWLGTLAGTFLGMALVSLLVEQFAFKNAPPGRRAELTVGTAFAIVAVLVVFTMADGKGLAWTAGAQYLPGAVLVYFWFKRRYERKWHDSDPQSETE